MGERFNYVALSGAHQLNMTRAFGNFGHKEWRGSKPVRTHSQPLERRRVCMALSLPAAERLSLRPLEQPAATLCLHGPLQSLALH